SCSAVLSCVPSSAPSRLFWRWRLFRRPPLTPTMALPPTQSPVVTSAQLAPRFLRRSPRRPATRRRSRTPTRRPSKAALTSRTSRQQGAAYEASWPASTPRRADEAALSRAGTDDLAMAFAAGDRVLSVAHYGQQKNYYCGPASGKMVLKYLNEGASAYNGN